MIPLTEVSWQDLSWQDLVKNAVSNVDDLVSALALPPQPHYSTFPINVPAPYLHRIEKGNSHDPLLLQVLACAQEEDSQPGFVDQPLHEGAFTAKPGLIQKYQGRVLIIVSGACAINCRYCFRRHFPYQDFQPDTEKWQSLLQYISEDSTITEVILSGGDPLMLSDNRFSRIVSEVERIAHVQTLRIHTRMPVVVPQRITNELLECLKVSRLKVVLVNHINHANELDHSVAEAMAKLAKINIVLLNQSVLLKRVNDSVPALAALSNKLFSIGILPYYLHLLDPVRGAAHFDVPAETGIALVSQLRDILPGYLVPRLVQEVPGTNSKQPLL